MTRIITVLLSLLGLLGVVGALPQTASCAYAEEAQPSADAKAAALKAYQRGTSYYQREEYDKAIEHFTSGYQSVPQGVFLYNIAQSHRLASRPEKALEFYRLYLEKSPDAKNRPEIEERIATLEKQLGIGGFPKMIVPDVPDGPEPAPAELVKVNGDKRSGAKTAGIVLGVIGGAAVIGTAIGLGIYFGTQNNTPVTVFQPVMP